MVLILIKQLLMVIVYNVIVNLGLVVIIVNIVQSMLLYILKQIPNLQLMMLNNDYKTIQKQQIIITTITITIKQTNNYYN